MKRIKSIVSFGVLIAVVDVAIIWILKIIGFVAPENFKTMISQSLSVIGVLVLVAIVISLFIKKSE